MGIEVRRLIGGEVRVSKRGNRIWSSGKGREVWGSKFGGEARVRVVVGISLEVRRGTVGGEGEGQ